MYNVCARVITNYGRDDVLVGPLGSTHGEGRTL